MRLIFKKGKKNNPGNHQVDILSAVPGGMEDVYTPNTHLQACKGQEGNQEQSAQTYKGKSYLTNLIAFYDKTTDWEYKD